MNSILAVQRLFQQSVLAGGSVVEPGAGAKAEVTGHFEIYVNAYRGRLVEALRDNFPGLYLSLGDDVFRELALAYVAHCPSRFRSIRWFGDALSGFMDAHPELVPHPALVDMARMDWAIRGAFDAADGQVLLSDDVAAIPVEDWPAQRFFFQPAVRLVELRWNVEPIWQLLNQDAEADTPPPEELEHTLLVWRQDLNCLWRSVDRIEAVALRGVAGGLVFADICERIAGEDEASSANTAAMLLRRWMEDGLLAKPSSDVEP